MEVSGRGFMFMCVCTMSLEDYNGLRTGPFMFICVCDLCLQYMNLSPLLFTVARVFFIQQIGSLELTIWSLVCAYISALCLFHLRLLVSSLFPCTLQEEDFQEMVRTTQLMETQYGHLFEKVIVNDDLSAAFSELRLALKKVETETHWVPVSWTHS